MKERPIIFSTEMIRAIFDRKKTQTRRVIKPQPTVIDQELFKWKDAFMQTQDLIGCCPYGQSGDRLWVRETWYPFKGISGDKIIYRVSDDVKLTKPEQWQSPIFMPRWASRIILEITDIRLERLQEIDKLDEYGQHIGNDAWLEGFRCPNPTAAFMLYWDSINSKRGYVWNENPWVWVISFKKI